MKSGGLLVAAIAGTAVIALIVWLVGERPGALSEQDEQIRLVSLVLMLVLVGSGFLVHWRNRPTLVWLRDGLTWLAIGFVLIAGYSLRDEFRRLFDRMAAEVMPGRGVETGSGTVIIRADPDGHFRVDSTVDGTRLRMLVDTGASAVVLSPDDARRIGLDPRRLVFSERARTANGIVRAAPIRLREIRIQSVTVRDVRALVNGAPMNASLLGLTFLNRLTAYSVRDNVLTLRR
jgi:aspartyl protease family protein